MSFWRNDFCEVAARGYGASCSPRKYGMNWTIPAVVSSSPVSGGGINEDDGTIRCPRSSKNVRNCRRMSFAFTEGSPPGVGRPELGLPVGHALPERLDEARPSARDVAPRGCQRLPRLAGEVGRREPLRLALQPAREKKGPGDARTEARGEPEQTAHASRSSA